MTVYGDGYQYAAPGQFDPIVNTKLQEALQQKQTKADFASNKKKIEAAIARLEKTIGRMNIAARNAWWSLYSGRVQTPTNFFSTCDKTLGSPNPLDCLRAVEKFDRRDAPVEIKPKKSLFARSGECGSHSQESIPLS